MAHGSIGNRIRQAVESHPTIKSQRQLANLLGMSPSKLNNYVQGVSDPPLEVLPELAMRLGVSVNWLLGEPEGFMEVGGVKYPAVNGSIQLPLIGSVSAGDWGDPTDTDDFEYVDADMVTRKGQFCTKIKGDSMFPFIHPGDLVICCKWINGGMVNHIVIARDSDNRLTLKQLIRRKDALWLHPLNDKYEDKLLESDPIGYVMGYIRVESDGERTTKFNPNGLKI